MVHRQRGNYLANRYFVAPSTGRTAIRPYVWVVPNRLTIVRPDVASRTSLSIPSPTFRVARRKGHATAVISKRTWKRNRSVCSEFNERAERSLFACGGVWELLPDSSATEQGSLAVSVPLPTVICILSHHGSG